MLEEETIRTIKINFFPFGFDLLQNEINGEVDLVKSAAG